MAGAGAGAGLILGIQFFNNGITLVLSINLPTCVFREFPEHTTVTTLVVSAADDHSVSRSVFSITKKAPTMAFKTLLRHLLSLTPQKVDIILGN